MNDLKFAIRQLLRAPASPPWPCSRSRSALGRTRQRSFTIVGVVAAFQIQGAMFRPEVWAPLPMESVLSDRKRNQSGVNRLMDRGSSWLALTARLAPAVTLAAADTAIAVRGRQLGQAYPNQTLLEQFTPMLVPLAQFARRDMARAQPAAVLFGALAGLVLLLPCLNLANLLLARSAQRQQEWTVRAALGAGRSRLIRQSLTETLLLAGLATVAGLLLSQWTTDALTHLIGRVTARAAFPFRPEARLDLNETMARAFWPDAEAVGQRLEVGDENGATWAEVVGVAKDGKYMSLFAHDRRPFAYRPMTTATRGRLHLAVRTTGPLAATLSVLRKEIAALDNRLSVFDLRPLDDRIAAWRLLPQMGAFLAGTMGLLALLLASLGLFGLLTFMVAQRTREIGLRVAMGADRRTVMALIFRQGLRLVGLGLGIGLLAALVGAQTIRGLLFGISALDPLAFGGVALVLIAVALLACWLPARRAANIDPMDALRYE